MIKIAFCDDEVSALNKIRVFLDRYREERNQDIEYVAFDNPLDLLAEIERGTRFDILFLDILMQGENGIDAAVEIRNYDTNVKIIFLTSSKEFAVQSYTVNAYYYQLKPIQEEIFFRLMDSVLSECEREQSCSVIVKCKSGIARIDLKHLEYCEVIHRTLIFHLSDGKTLESTGSLDKLSEELAPFGCFLRPHRSYLVNLDYVQNLSYRAIMMSGGTQIPIPHGKYNEIKDVFFDYAFRRSQIII